MRLPLGNPGKTGNTFNILLVTAYRSFSLAAAYFYEILKREFGSSKGVYLHVRDYSRFFEEVDYSFIRDILLIRPDIIGFSNFFWNFKSNIQLAELAKSLHGESFIIFGGPQTGHVEKAFEILEENRFINGVLCGEADLTFPALVKAAYSNLPFADIPGFVTRPMKDIGLYDRSYFVKNLSDLPVIYNSQSGYVQSTFNRWESTPLETLRGCRSGCSYCFYCANILRFKPLKTVEKEIEFLCKNRARYVRICDSHFGGTRARAMELFDIIKYYNSGNTSFFLYPDPEHIDSEYLATAKKAGCNIISLGIETLDKEISKRIGRRIPPEKSLRALSEIKKENINPQVDLIFGLPGQTVESFTNDIIQLLLKGSNDILFSPLMLFPGTKLETETDSQELQVLNAPQNYCLSDRFGKESYARAFEVIELFQLAKIFRHSIDYLCGSYFDKSYEALYSKLFAPESVDNEAVIGNITEILGSGADFILDKCEAISENVREFFSSRLEIDPGKIRYIGEIIRFELHKRAMIRRADEQRRDIFFQRESSRIYIWEEISNKKFILKEDSWLGEFGIPSKFLTGALPDGDLTEPRTCCVFICESRDWRILNREEFDFLQSLQDGRGIDDLTGDKNKIQRDIVKWIKAGAIAPA